ncbi:hypothetical protein OG884_26430 [Streptosporangium sp. NBC_01755]|uniref:hypothetical protein n=1 Tax=Streptosporangium sp. NBC_01755 TaxID=2975949 RepID=UPI002DDA3211|nr:hypothetical protein [Streptosporangium sp. NBC_01755]WSC98386.1 hypothetical protein OG884_26430 [Streptosporangium sp. NBC_01755]
MEQPRTRSAEESSALAAVIGHAFPRWTVWHLNGWWYAAGPHPGGMCARTLHATQPGDLCRQVDDYEQRPPAMLEAAL